LFIVTSRRQFHEIDIGRVDFSVARSE